MDLVTTHINADADGLGALVAARLLEPEVVLGLPGAFDETVRALLDDHGPDLPLILTRRPLEERIAREPLGRLVAVDTARPERLGFLAAHLARFTSVEAWDTHPPLPGDLPRVPLAPAGAVTSILIGRLAAAGRTPTPVEAGVMLVAIHVDTGHFTFPSTTAADHAAAARCLAWGADATWPGRYAPKGFTAHQLGLLERMARGVEVVGLGGLQVGLSTLELDGWEPDLAVLLNELRDAEGWSAAFLLAVSDGKLWVIGRSDERLDVGGVLRAVSRAGGGHPAAGSAILPTTNLAEARTLVLAAVRSALDGALSVGAAAIRDFVRLDADASISAAGELLHRHRLNALPLVRGTPPALAVVGQVTRQEVDAALRHGLGDRPAWEISAARPQRVAPGEGVLAARRLLERGRGRILVVGEADAPPVGIVTRTTLLRAAAGEVPLAPASRPPHPRVVAGMLGRALGPSWARVEALGALAAELGMGLDLVGGAVRDMLLGLPVADVDLVVEGDAGALATRAAARLGGEVSLHAAFDTAKWRPAPGEPTIDLASARAEVYPGRAALPEVVHAGLERDLQRRDFTINAMAAAVDPARLGEIRDPFGGLSDLRAGLVRVLHGLSFHDDPTRAFRAARFAARLDFRLAEDTAALVRAALRSGAFDALGLERLGAELTRLLDEAEVLRGLRLVREWGLATALHPRLSLDGALLGRVGAVRDAVLEARGLRGGSPDTRQADALWMVLADGIPGPDRSARQRLVPGGAAEQRRFRAGLEGVRALDKRLRNEPRAGRAGVRLGEADPVERVVLLGLGEGRTPDWVRWWEREGRHVRAAVNGRDLMAAGVPRGPAVGAGLRAALSAAWEGASPAGQRSAALAAAQAAAAG